MSLPVFTSKEMIAKLVGFDTVSAKSNLNLIEWVCDYLAAHGIESRKTYDPGGEKANLYATVGPDTTGGIVLSGHSDVVPVEGQDWSSDPFTVLEKGGKLYGRGTSDMKSFLAIALALVPEMTTRKLDKPIHLALSFDEEVGCTGVGHMLKDIDENLNRPAIAIVGEPSSMKIVSAHKGVIAQRTEITGLPAHSSQPHRGANAIIAAGRIIDFIWRLSKEKREEAKPELGFEPPYTSFQIGTIEGGTALNIIAGSCSFTWEFRPLPGDEPSEILSRIEDYITQEVLPDLREFAPQADIRTTSLAKVPALSPETDGAAEALVRHLSGLNQSGVVSYGTEGGLFQEIGISTVVCGPGSIDQAHQPNEFIEISQVEACEAFLKRLIAWAESPVKL